MSLPNRPGSEQSRRHPDVGNHLKTIWKIAWLLAELHLRSLWLIHVVKRLRCRSSHNGTTLGRSPGFPAHPF